MSVTLAFDVYGTLIDTNGVVSALEKLVGDKAADFSRTWREKQLEYSFRRGLMQNYVPFAQCTAHALDYACTFHSVELPNSAKKDLLECYRTLPAFEDVKAGLAQLKASGYRLFAFSNGTTDAVNSLLITAGIREFFEGIVSVDDLKTFKPNPAVYSHFLRASASKAHAAWLISSNPFDVIGAISAGMHAAWVKRSTAAIFDPWDIEPDVQVEHLGQLPAKLADNF